MFAYIGGMVLYFIIGFVSAILVGKIIVVFKIWDIHNDYCGDMGDEFSGSGFFSFMMGGFLIAWPLFGAVSLIVVFATGVIYTIEHSVALIKKLVDPIGLLRV